MAPEKLIEDLTGLQSDLGPALGPGQQRHPGVVVPLGVRPAHHLAWRSPDSTGRVVVERRGGESCRGHLLAKFFVVRAAVTSSLTARVTVTTRAGSTTLPLAATNSLRSTRHRCRRRGGGGRGRGGCEKTEVSIILTTISNLETI